MKSSGVIKKILASVILIILLVISGSQTMSYAYNMYVRRPKI